MAWDKRSYDAHFGGVNAEMVSDTFKVEASYRKAATKMFPKTELEQRYEDSVRKKGVEDLWPLVTKRNLSLQREAELRDYLYKNFYSVKERLDAGRIVTYTCADGTTIRINPNRKVTEPLSAPPPKPKTRQQQQLDELIARYGSRTPTSQRVLKVEAKEAVKQFFKPVTGFLKAAFAPIDQWLRVKPNEESTMEVRDNANQPPTGSSEGSSSAE